MPPRTPEPPDFPASQLFLRRLAFSLVRDEARAEDLVQDTWAAWVERRPSGVAEPRAWLARVLRNRAFNLKRGERRRAEREELAGRPDPSAPETDGTLEAQAQLIEALRKLEEPYRSTLVERYYHDLSPKEIAERSGAPLNTIKARLLRGLTKLREEMDRRYRGDRSAWCHWLMPLCAPAVPIPAPHGTAAAPQGPAPFAGMGGGGGMSLLGWLALAGVLGVGAVLKMEWGRAPRGEKHGADERQASIPSSEPRERAERRRVPVASEVTEQPRASAPLVRSKPSPTAPGPLLPPTSGVRAFSAGRETFDWPQYAGGADHDNYREREDEIFAPKVLWFVPGCAGQPTLEGGDLYTGGLTCFRLDPDTGQVVSAALELWAEGLEVDLDAAGPRALHEARALMKRLESFDPNDVSHHTVAPAPVITSSLVLARRTRDGGVSAFDRELDNEVWSWDGNSGEPIRIPLCLASDELVLVASYSNVIALRVADGTEAWRFHFNGRVRMAPASDGKRAYFGMDRGVFFALDLETGKELWKMTSAGAFGSTSPVVLGKRVFAADLGGLDRWRVDELEEHGELEDVPLELERSRLYALDVSTGRVRWRSALEGFLVSLASEPERSLVVSHCLAIDRFDLDTGKRDERDRVVQSSHPCGSPAVVGKSLVSGGLDGSLSVHDLESGELRWSFQVANAEVVDFVHTGKRIYVATSTGLFCIGDDPRQAPAAEGFVLEWNGNPREGSFVAEEKK